MKILLINNGKGWSGGQEHLKDLALELRGRGVEIHFVARAGTPSETRFRNYGFPVFARCPTGTASPTSWRWPAWFPSCGGNASTSSRSTASTTC